MKGIYCKPEQQICQFFAYQRQKVENVANFRYLRLNLSVLERAPKARPKNLEFYRGTVHDVIKFHGMRQPLPPTLLTLMGACSLITKFCFSQNSHPKFLTSISQEIFQDKHKYQLDFHIRQNLQYRENFTFLSIKQAKFKIFYASVKGHSKKLLNT